MTEFNVGDRVRVTFEGEVTYVNEDGSLDVSQGEGFDRSAEFVATSAITLLHRVLPKVGDGARKS